MIRLVPYLKFLKKATNQHGVHSPFVYAYVTECLYKKPRLSKHKTKNVVLQTLSFFKNKGYRTYKNEDLNTLLNTEQQLSTDEIGVFDFLYFETPDIAAIKAYIKKKRLSTKAIVILGGIHTSRNNTVQWNTLAKMQGFTVSIDLYYCGVLFCRPEQEKEHFHIRT